MWRIKADDKPYRKRSYSPSVTLALTIAKVCGVTVEEVFYLEKEENNGESGN